MALTALPHVKLGWGAHLPLLLQSEAAECGLACLAMIVAYHGAPCDLPAMRRRFGMSLKGASLNDLVRIAEDVGLAARPLRLDLQELGLLKRPCILHWDLNHFVVLKDVTRTTVVIHDPAVGVRQLSMAEASKHFTGVALELAPLGSFELGQAAPRVRMSTVLGRVVGLKRSLGQLALLSLAIEVFAIVSPFYIQWVVDDGLVTGDRDLLLTLLLGFTLLLLLRVGITAMRGWMLIGLGASLKVQGRANLMSHLLKLPTAYFEARHLGDVMSRFSSQDSILQAITTDLVEAILDGVLASATLVIMFVFAPALAMIVLVGGALYVALRWTSYTPLRQSSAESIVWSARRDSHFLETLRGIRTIKLFNAQDDRRTHWLNLLVEALNRQLTVQKLRLLFRIWNSFLLGAMAVLVIWLGALRVLDNSLTVGTLLAFIAYKDQFLDRMSNLVDRSVDLYMLRLHSERLADIALTAPEPRDDPLVGRQLVGPASLEVRNLRFRYGQNEPWVIDGLHFRIEPGESVAIVGPSGCGKTTLLKLMTSLLSPTEGEILIGGQPLSRIGIERYRSMIGVVMQEDGLFAGSIAENISFFSESPDRERIEHCAALAAIHDDIMAMPMAYSTLIGDMGTTLSGGQKQRVLIARALYRRPSILFLDEATSHLDVMREAAVSTAIRKTNITRVIVAHRPETVRSTDRVITLYGAGVANAASSAEHSEVPVRATF